MRFPSNAAVAANVAINDTIRVPDSPTAPRVPIRVPITKGAYSGNAFVMASRRHLPYVTAAAKWSPRISPWAAAVAGPIIAFGLGKLIRPNKWDFTGYRLAAECPLNGPGTWLTHVHSWPNCQPAGFLIPGFPPLPGTHPGIAAGTGRPSNVFLWGALVNISGQGKVLKGYQHWTLVNANGPKVGEAPIFRPSPRPGIDPFAWPASIVPFPLPLRLPAPYVPVTLPFDLIPQRPVAPLGPTPDYQAGYGDPDPNSRPGSKPMPSADPWPKPRDKKREREKKMRRKIPAVIAGQKVVYATTEGLDALECLWKAVKPWERPVPTERLGEIMGAEAINPEARVVSPQDKMVWLYENWEKIQWVRKWKDKEGNVKTGGALMCLALNHVSDAVIGRIAGGAQSEATRREVILGLLG